MHKSKSSSKEKEKEKKKKDKDKDKDKDVEEQSVKRRRGESSVEELADAELDRIGSDMEEGGLDLSLPFQPISDYVADRREMLDQCLQVLGEKKLQKMLPDELKSCPLEEIKKLCWEQLEQLSQKNLLQILGGEELTSGDDDDDGNADVGAEATSTSQQDNIVDSTSSIKETDKTEDPKQDDDGSGMEEEEDEADVLSINADTGDFIAPEKPAEEGEEERPSAPSAETAPAAAAARGGEESAAVTATVAVAVAAVTKPPSPAEKELETDIDKSVSEILANSAPPERAGAQESPQLNPGPPSSLPSSSSSSCPTAPLGLPAEGAAGPDSGPPVCQPSLQQLELLELEMRARAIKALMKAGDGKKPS